MYEGNLREIDFGLSWREGRVHKGFELSAINSISTSKTPTPPCHITEARKRHPFRAGPLPISDYKEYPLPLGMVVVYKY